MQKKKDSGTNIMTDSPPRAGVYGWLGCFQIRSTPWRGWTFRTSGGWGPCPDRGCQSRRLPPPDDHTWSGQSPGPDPAESSRAASPWRTEEKFYIKYRIEQTMELLFVNNEKLLDNPTSSCAISLAYCRHLL